jgi:hypothetical protein
MYYQLHLIPTESENLDMLNISLHIKNNSENYKSIVFGFDRALNQGALDEHIKITK